MTNVRLNRANALQYEIQICEMMIATLNSESQTSEQKLQVIQRNLNNTDVINKMLSVANEYYTSHMDGLIKEFESL